MTTVKRVARQPGQPEEGHRIEVARNALGYSQRYCARQIGVSQARWRDLVYGLRRTKDGGQVVGGAAVFARMARVVRLPAEAFDQCRPDIADELRSTGDLDRVIAGGGEEVATRKLTHDQVVALLLHVRTMTDEVTLKEALLSLGLLHIGGEPPRTM